MSVWKCRDTFAIVLRSIVMAVFTLTTFAQLALSHADESCLDLTDLTDRQVSTLLQCQVARIWTEDLLAEFPADQDKASVVPVTLFPVPTGHTGSESFRTIGFEKWCEEHVDASASRDRGIDSGLLSLVGAGANDETLALAEKFAGCAISNKLDPVLRLSAVGVVANRNARDVRDSLLTFALAWVTLEGDSQDLHITSLPAEAGRLPVTFLLREMGEELLSTLKQVPETEVLADYIRIVDAVKNGGQPRELLVNASKAKFTPPFLTCRGREEKQYGISISREPAFGRAAEESQRLLPESVEITEFRVLESYRSNIDPHSQGRVIYTLSRYELAKFTETLADVALSALDADGPLRDALHEPIDLLTARFFQVDDVSVFTQMIRLNERVERKAERADDLPDETRRPAATWIGDVLRELTAQPKEVFGVSVVRLYDVLKGLRAQASAWEASLSPLPPEQR